MDNQDDSYWRVMLNGENFWIRVEDQPKRLGFFTTRLVRAASADEAESIAVQMIREDPDFLRPLNDVNDPPMIYMEEIVEVDVDEYNGPTDGYTFYDENDDA